jgi:fructose-bisphosphate aldolase class 1
MAGDFDIQRSMEAHIAAYSVLFQKLALHKVDLAGLVLKASMVVCGDKRGKASPEEVGEGKSKSNISCAQSQCLALSLLQRQSMH